MIINVKKEGYTSKPDLFDYAYPYPELVVTSKDAYANTVQLVLPVDTAGDSAAYIDFTIKIDGTPATITSLVDGGDSTINLNISETITNPNIITLTYVPNSSRWITGPSGTPAYVLHAMTDAEVDNQT